MAERNLYGVFDAKLEKGEEIVVEVSPLPSTVIEADENNEIVRLGTVDCGGESSVAVNFGGNTFLSDYLLIQRNADDDIDFWIRCDDSHLGVNEE